MVKLRQEKVNKIADYIPLQKVDNGNESGKIAVVGWGSTYGSIKTAVRQLRAEGFDVSHIHIRYLNPFPKNLEQLLRSFQAVIVPEINNGQLVKIIRDKFLINAIPFNKIKGLPFTVEEIVNKVKEINQKL
jgi:2-oxoglutarate ferredoxin oxidoreductase subunit alpha